MPYRCRNFQGDYDGNIYQDWGDAYKRANLLNKIHNESWYPELIEDNKSVKNNKSVNTSHINRNSDNISGWIVVVFIIIVIGSEFYDKIIAKYIDISNVTYYCSPEQLPKTGKKACIDAKNIIIKRLRENLKYANESLEAAQLKTPIFLQDKNKKCTESGLDVYGTEGCAKAQNSLKEHYKEIEELKNEIKTYQFDINKYKRLGINGSHIVDTDILNLRNCASTNCHIIAKLSLGEGVWLQETKGEWAKIRSEKGEGFVANKFLIKNKDKVSYNQNK